MCIRDSAKTAVYDKTDSGSWGPVLDGSMKEAWNGETYAYSNYCLLYTSGKR